ncbi:hypothetical protein HZH68_013961 [Vespula germanica]|uniref:Uncharacterized protein n=1 Tax=Vespula germanica TaxID=30212 RepID=A0A834JHE0_VESGE|nr:hypothetical protein HZH68_013961 [Vespula germanica]
MVRYLFVLSGSCKNFPVTRSIPDTFLGLSLLIISLTSLNINFCQIADFFAIFVIPTRNACLWSFEVLDSFPVPEGFPVRTYVLNNIEMLDFERCSHLKDCEIFKCSVNIFSSSKSDVTVIFLIMRPLAVTNLEPQSVCLALKSSAIIFCVVVKESPVL